MICANTVEVVHALDPSRYPAIDCHFFEELRSVCEQGIHDRVERLGLHFKFHSSAPTGHAGALLHVSPGKWKVVFCQPNISSLCAQIGKALLKNKTKLAISCPTLLADSRSTASIMRHAFAALFTEQCLELDLPEGQQSRHIYVARTLSIFDNRSSPALPSPSSRAYHRSLTRWPAVCEPG